MSQYAHHAPAAPTAWQQRVAPHADALRRGQRPAAEAIRAILSATHDLTAIERLAAELRARFKHIVVMGAGGSGLSGKALLALKVQTTPSLHILDNMDPHSMEQLFAGLDLTQTGFLVISKSGATAETSAQYLVARAALGSNKNQITVITEPTDNPMRRLAQQDGSPILDFPTDIGGRFSILTIVGLLPAAIGGIDIRALREGAASASLDEAAKGAALQLAAMESGRRLSVMMPYGDGLSGLALWYRQCWAESLGKNGLGSTPIYGRGTVDQHSQLQLYLDGPDDKFFTFITAYMSGQGQCINASGEAAFGYLHGKTIGDVVAAEQRATIESILARRPGRTFEIAAIDERAVGALIAHFMLEIMLVAYTLNLDPFDQPAIEDSKRKAREYLA